MKIYILVNFIALLSSSYCWAESCQVQGQVVVAQNGDSYIFQECLPGMAGGLSPRPLAGSFLADFITANQNNPQVQKMLDTVVPGMAVNDVASALKGGQTLVTPEPSELTGVAELYNERMGINNDIENLRAQEKANGKKTDRSMSDLSQVVDTNLANLPQLQKSCSSGGRIHLRPLVVNYDDNEKSHIFPTGLNSLGDGKYQLRYLDLGSDKEQTRQIETDGGKYVWIAPDGKKYPLKENPFTEITDEAMAAVRDFNSGNQPASCYLASKLPALTGNGEDTSSPKVNQ
jgi:hypothetical protein